jgi:hypothetical protein
MPSVRRLIAILVGPWPSTIGLAHCLSRRFDEASAASSFSGIEDVDHKPHLVIPASAGIHGTDWALWIDPAFEDAVDRPRQRLSVIAAEIGCHRFRATGITAYLSALPSLCDML